MTEKIEDMFNAPDDEVRREAALYLKDHTDAIETGRAIQMLVRALMDSSWRVRKTAVDILVEAYPAESYFDSIISLLYESDNAGARNSAIELFVKIGATAADRLYEAFETNDSDVRKFLIDIAGEISHRKMIPLLTLALKDKDENVKASAVEHLGALKEPRVVDALLNILQEGDLWTSYPAIEALGSIRDRKALPALVEVLSDKMLREPALRALGSLDGEDVVKHIVPYLTDQSRSVRQVAIFSLEKLYENGVSGDAIGAEIERYYGEEAGALLLDAAGSGTEELRLSALMLLGIMRDVRAVRPLLQAAADGVSHELVVRSLVHISRDNLAAILDSVDWARKDPVMTRVLVSSMAEMKRPEFMEPLAQMLKDVDGHVRAEAALGLGNLGDSGAIPLLLEAVYDKYEDVRRAVIVALVKLNAGLEPMVIETFIKDKDPEVRKLAVPLLVSIDTDEARSSMTFMLKDPSHHVRRASVDYFANNLDESNDTMLLHALTDESSDVRSAVAIRLGETRNAKYIKPLVLLLADNEDIVRVSACKALGLMGDAQALKPLSVLLYDKNGFVAASSIESIARIGGPDSVGIIEGMLSSNDNEIRRTTIRALSSFESACESILPYLGSEDWATRFEAVKALSPYIHRESVLNSLRNAYEEENDSVVRDALKEVLNA